MSVPIETSTPSENEQDLCLWQGALIIGAAIIVISFTFITIVLICKRYERRNSSRYIYQTRSELVNIRISYVVYTSY